MRPLLMLIAMPIGLAAAQVQSPGPYARANRGVGAVKFEGGPVTAVEAGVAFRRYLAVGLERVTLGGTAEAGKWALATARVYPLRAGKNGGVWIAAGFGAGSSRMTEHNGPRSYTDYRAKGLATSLAGGLEVRIVPHVYLTPVASSRSVHGTERNTCMRDVSPSGVFSPWTCSGWGSGRGSLSAFEFSIGITAR